MKISEALQATSKQLQKAGVDSPALDAKILLEAATGKTRAQLISQSETELSAQEISILQRLVQQRCERRPIAQILGYKEFYGRDFFVDENVLTPRPETELIIDAVKAYYVANASFSALDLGTGSGCIAITLAKEFPQAKIFAVDKSKKAVAIAQKNAYNLGVDSADFFCSDWLESIKTGAKFDIIISNPPYISLLERNNLAKELDFEPNAALFAEQDGLACYVQIAQQINKVFFTRLIVEIGKGQEAAVIEIFERHELKFETQHKDLAGIVRTLVFSKNNLT